MKRADRHDVIVIGSGFGGCMAAHVLVNAGARVLMLERGDWLERGPHNWAPDGIIDLRPHYSAEAGYPTRGEHRGVARALHCVGGLSVYYGGVSLRLRERDFDYDPRLSARSGGRWPFSYHELEPYYAEAERILGVAGGLTCDDASSVCADPTEPPRSGGYPHPPAPLSDTSRLIADAARSIGLQPFRLPLAIRHSRSGEQGACVSCTTCDGFACAVRAKSDMSSAVLPRLLGLGLRLETNLVARRLHARGDRIVGVECVDRRTLRPRLFSADQYVVAGGALASAHLLLASGLAAHNPAGDAIGRYLMRHCNGIVFGIFPTPPNPQRTFHKQIGIHDHYFGGADAHSGGSKRGSIQQVHSPPVGLALSYVPPLLHARTEAFVDRMTGLLVIAEDEARRENGVTLHRSAVNSYGMPRMHIRHRYTRRDRAARHALLQAAKHVLRTAGARFFFEHRIRTFSHALGTVRLGDDPHADPLDHACRFRGVANLRVVDGSAFPASGGVNPSLTIAANALRAAHLMIDNGGRA